MKIQKDAQVTVFANFTKFIFPLSDSESLKKIRYDLPSIESSDFLFWHEKSFESVFCKFCGKETKEISQVQIYCVFTHTVNFKE